MLLLTLLFVSSAIASPLLGTEQCARGPPYWCQNVKTASLCGAVSHCQQNMWNKAQMKTVPCDVCKEALKVVDQLLKDNKTQTEILEYMEKVCQLIPDESLVAECKEMVDEYYPILVNLIIAEAENPDVACSAIGLCHSQQMALAKLDAHRQLVSNEIPQVDLSQRVAPFLLNVPGLLYPQDGPKRTTPSPKNDVVCDDCVKFLTDAQTEAKQNTSFINALIERIESQCDLLGPGMSDMCKQYISQYAPLVVQQLLTMDPKKVCAMSGFCDPTKKSTPMLRLQPALTAKVVPAAKLFPALKMVSASEKASKPMVRVRESPTCTLCELVMKQLETMLEDETTEDKVIEAVEKVCQLLPSTLSTQCQDLIETYGKAIIELLVNQADPKTVCTLLALCNDASRQFVAELDKPKFQAGGYCDVCKMAVNYIDSILEQNATEVELEEAVRKVCSFLPSAYKTECDQLVQQYEPMLVQLLLQALDPDFVCTKIGACPSASRRLFGMEKCSWGPSFWCQNMDTATRCNAVTHCKRHVWV